MFFRLLVSWCTNRGLVSARYVQSSHNVVTYIIQLVLVQVDISLFRKVMAFELERDYLLTAVISDDNNCQPPPTSEEQSPSLVSPTKLDQ